MARRPRQRSSEYKTYDNTLGQDFHHAVNNLELLRGTTIYAMCTPEFTAGDVAESMFPHDILEILKHARRYSECDKTWVSYQLPALGLQPTAIHLNFQAAPWLAPDGECMKLDMDRFEPIAQFARRVVDYHTKFAVAMHVLKWLDTHCTAGAMRHYWPSILALAPGAAAVSDSLPRRFNEPATPIAPLLPLLRESATTITMALLVKANIEKPEYTYSDTFGVCIDAIACCVHDVALSIPSKTYTWKI